MIPNDDRLPTSLGETIHLVRELLAITEDVDRRLRLAANNERDANRYRWLREHPAFETEAFLGGLTPEEFDKVVDERRSA